MVLRLNFLSFDGSYRSGVPGKLSVKFGYQDETVRSNGRAETHLGD